MNNNSIILLRKINKLEKNGGSIIFNIGDYYIQFAKEKSDTDIHFEAVSHNFLGKISKNLQRKFLNLSFQIEEGNYFKKVNKKDIKSLPKEVEFIFKEIYKIDYEQKFDIIDDIEYSKTTSNDSISNETVDHTNTPKNGLLNFLSICGVIAIIYWVFFNDEKPKIGSMNSKACIISEEFIKRELISPKSADFGFCEESKTIHLGDNRYQVVNYVESLNYYGVPIKKNYLIILKYNTGRWEDINNWMVESIKIE